MSIINKLKNFIFKLDCEKTDYLLECLIYYEKGNIDNIVFYGLVKKEIENNLFKNGDITYLGDSVQVPFDEYFIMEPEIELQKRDSLRIYIPFHNYKLITE